MKTEKELNSDILAITMKIQATHPELYKFINEMPVKASDPAREVDLKGLSDYYDSLVELLEKYNATHTDTDEPTSDVGIM